MRTVTAVWRRRWQQQGRGRRRSTGGGVGARGRDQLGRDEDEGLDAESVVHGQGCKAVHRVPVTVPAGVVEGPRRQQWSLVELLEFLSKGQIIIALRIKNITPRKLILLLWLSLPACAPLTVPCFLIFLSAEN